MGIQALEDSVIALFDFPKLRDLAKNDFRWSTTILAVTEQLYLEKEWRESFL